jgi:TonB family protein
VLSHAAIERVASQHGRELSKCDAGAQHGGVTVRFSVDPAGKVSQAELVTTVRKPSVAACILRTVHAWQFPPQAEPGAVGTYTLSFR